MTYHSFYEKHLVERSHNKIRRHDSNNNNIVVKA
jgi:hypothetical protein